MNIDQATNIATNIATGIAARIADAPLGPPGIALTVVIANLFVIASLLAVLWWMRRVPSRIRDRAAAGANVVTLSELAHRDPRAVDIAPLCVTGVLTADPGPELLSPVTRRRCAMFRVELDRVSELTGARAVGRQANVCSDVPVVLTDRTGSALIDPELLAPAPEWGTDTRRTGAFPRPGELYVRPERTVGTTEFVQREFVVPVGATITVAGRIVLDEDGRLRPARRCAPLTLTADAPADLARAADPDPVTRRRIRRQLAAVGLLTAGAVNAALLLGLAR